MLEKVMDKFSKTKWQIPILLFAIVLFMFSLGIYNIPILAWIYPICLIFVFRNSRSKIFVICSVLLLAAACYLKYQGFLGSTTGDLMIVASNFFVIAIPLLLDRWFYKPLKRHIGAWAILFLPFMYAFISATEKMTIGLTRIIGFSQTSLTSLMQSTSVFGISGISILILSFATLLLYICESKLEGKSFKVPLISYVCIFVLVLCGGSAWIAAHTVIGDNCARIAIAQTSQDSDFTEEGDTVDSEGDIAYIKKQSKRASDGEAVLLCFGEEAFFVEGQDKDYVLEAAKVAAKDNDIYLVVPFEYVIDPQDEDSKRYNELYLIDNNGNEVGHYVKSNLIPILEDTIFIKGDGQPLHADIPYDDGKTFKASFALCYDADIELFLSDCESDSDVAVIPSWCWDEINPYHTNIMRFRAIENNISIVNPSCYTKSTVIDMLGNIIAVSDDQVTGIDHVTFADLPIMDNPHRTIYHDFGWVIYGAYSFVALLMLALGIFWKIKDK